MPTLTALPGGAARGEGLHVRGRRPIRVLLAITAVALFTTACGPRFEQVTSTAPGAVPGQPVTGLEGQPGVPGAPIAGPGGSPVAAGPGTAPIGPGTNPGTGPSAPGSSAAPGSSTAPGQRPGSSSPPAAQPVPAGSKAGVTDTTINLAYLIPKQGAAPVPPQVEDGIKSYWEQVVNAKGGIFGRKVTVRVYDTKSTDSDARVAAQNAISDGAFAVVALDRLGVQGTIARYLDERGVPNIAVQLPVDTPASMQWTFGITIDHRFQGGLIAQYFARGLKVRKVAVVYEKDSTLHPGVDNFKSMARKVGLDVVQAFDIDANQGAYLSEVQRLQTSGAEAVWLYMAPIPANSIATTGANNGYKPAWFANSISWNFNLALSNGDAFAKAHGFSPWPAYDDPRTAAYRPYTPSGGSKTQDLGIPGYGIGQIMAAALVSTGSDLGRNSFRNAFQNLRLGNRSPFDGGPLLWNPLGFGPGVRNGGVGAVTYKTVDAEGAQAKWAPEADYRTSY
ncbi:MAG TPA: ABC transporter substrate-binding protein [Mycobacteriales bacterium]|nr:ABC transporter substrate-binding protein [Mycobacteriales bacterium]